MLAFILAGGLGTRLSHILKDTPKPMAPIGKKPFLKYIIEALKKQNISNIVLLTGYKSEVIENYFGNGKDFGISISYSREDKPLGTGGAILKAARKYPNEEDFLILNGDTYFDINYSYLESFHKEKKSIFTMALKLKQDLRRYGSVIIDEEYKVKKFIEKGSDHIEGFINGGISIMNKRALSFFKKEGFLSLENDIMEELLSSQRVYGLPFGGKFIDIGIPEDYFLAKRELKKWVGERKIKVAFLDRDGVINEDDGYTYRVEDLRLMNGIIPFLKELKKRKFYFIIITNQAGIGKGYFTENDYKNFQKALINRLKKEGIKILDSFYCPYHTEAIVEKYRRESLLRKPAPGMILMAAEKYPIDLFQSIMIGDRESDRIRLPYLKCYILKGKYSGGDSLKIYSDYKEILGEL